MGLKEELADLKKSKLSVQLPPAEIPAMGQRDSQKLSQLAVSAKGMIAAPASSDGDLPQFSSFEEAKKSVSKTIPVIAAEIMRENVERKNKELQDGERAAQIIPQKEPKLLEMASPGTSTLSGKLALGGWPEQSSAISQKGLALSPRTVPDDKVLFPPPMQNEPQVEPVGQRKSITQIAEQIIAEKMLESGSAPSNPKSVEEMMEGEEKIPSSESGSTSLAKDNLPRKTLPAIAEEIRREMGIDEKKGELVLPEPPAPPYAASSTPTAMIDRLAEAKQKAVTPEPKRLYLLKPDERVTPVKHQEGTQPILPHRRLYDKEQGKDGGENEPPGFEDMVSEVYVQVRRKEESEKPLVEQERKDEAEQDKRRREEEARKQFEERRRQRDARKMSGQPKKDETEVSAVPQSMSIEELLGEKPGKETKAGGLFGELEKEASGGSGKSLFAELDEASKPAAGKKQAEFTVVDKEKGCPNCKSAATKIVYCPYCGGAMCANCATKITPYPDHFTYVCPHCSEEVEVKKKAA